ncbi:uncharacterized protein LOC120932882 isoform X2 [Rana temporaria]|uniref:uncharacterized protein LOC120932882 isoform X2 n=1 Tax=Rana temporaria TaxID=8407 RepID=UPI001AAD3581|nr:uncharacterized protein LOC120932882 isoform X2 [Rana temporaria]
MGEPVGGGNSYFRLLHTTCRERGAERFRGAIHPHSLLRNMESLRRLMSRKKDNPWKTVNDNWDDLLKTFRISTLVANKDRNPWKGWCRSWEMYERTHSKTPKSGKERAAVWRELYNFAKFTEDRLDEATAMHQQLTKQAAEFTNLQNENLLLKTKCESLQKKFDYEATAMWKRLETQTAELANLQNENLLLKTKCESLQKKFDYEATAMRKRLETQKAGLTNFQEENFVLKTKCESLKEQLHSEQIKNVMDEHRHKKELEEEVNEKQLAQYENNEFLKQRNELERQLVQVKQDLKVYQIHNYNQYHKNITVVNCQHHLEGEESWHEQAKRAGVGCPSYYKIWERLANYEDPNTPRNATFWQLVIRLSRREDLGTREAI